MCTAQACSECWQMINDSDEYFYVVIINDGNRYRICRNCFDQKMLDDTDNINQVKIIQSACQACDCGKHFGQGQTIDLKPGISLSLLQFQGIFGITWGVYVQH